METVRGGCPVCGNDVVGNDEFRFFCKTCNVLYKRSHLAKPIPDHPAIAEMKRLIEPKPEPVVDEREPKPIVGMDRKQLETKFIVSLQTNKYKKGKYHHLHCPFIRKILDENLFYFETEHDARQRNYEECTCLKSKVKQHHRYVMAKEGSKYHLTTCPFATQIREDNRLYFDSVDATPQAKTARPCDCLTKKG